MGAATSAGSARLLGVMATAPLTAHGQHAPGHQRSRSDRRRGTSARCRESASRFFVPPTSSTRPSTWSSAPSLLVDRHATTYGPSLGARFLTRDPVAPISRDPFGYASGDPVNSADPTGLCPTEDETSGLTPDQIRKCHDLVNEANEILVRSHKVTPERERKYNEFRDRNKKAIRLCEKNGFRIPRPSKHQGSGKTDIWSIAATILAGSSRTSAPPQLRAARSEY